MTIKLYKSPSILALSLYSLFQQLAYLFLFLYKIGEPVLLTVLFNYHNM